MQIALCRIGRSRGHEGFGDAREVQNILSSPIRRQADRLHRSRQREDDPDDLLLRKIGIIGPEPSHAAKLYGTILVALGLLNNGKVIVKNPADFVGGALGRSEKDTKAILEPTKGRVLIVDKACMVASGLSSSGGINNPYKTAFIDTIVAEVQSTVVEDRCMLLLRYPVQIEEMFQKVNPGLTRHFLIFSAFVFDDYNDSELRSILDLKRKQQGFRAGETAKQARTTCRG